jgi:hypothetical protein
MYQPLTDSPENPAVVVASPTVKSASPRGLNGSPLVERLQHRAVADRVHRLDLVLVRGEVILVQQAAGADHHVAVDAVGAGRPRSAAPS